MAERIGTTRGAARPDRLRVGAANVGTVPVPPPVSGAARAWGVLAQTAGDIASKAHDRYDRNVRVQAHEAGVMAAIKGPKHILQLDRSTTRGAAYHDAAISTLATTMETNALVAMTDLAREHADNPAALSEGIEAYATGAVGEMEGLSPEAAVAVRSRIVTQSIPLINGAIENRERKQADLLKAQRERALAVESSVITQFGADIFSEPDESAAAVGAVSAARGRADQFLGEEEAEALLLSRLDNNHGAAHVVNLGGAVKTRLPGLMEAGESAVGGKFTIGSGFRSVERQRELWTDAVKKYGSESAARKWVAPPGSSQHNHGNAVDLYWNGKRLDYAPASVQKWVRENSGAYGLKLPLGNEPWHVEAQETRGGAPFKAPKVAGLGMGEPPADGSPLDPFANQDQDFYDEVIGAGARAWFGKQRDKTAAYTALVAGELELPMHPGGERVMVNVAGRLSAKARGALESELREQIRFETSLRDDAEQKLSDASKERSDATRAGYVTGILFAGSPITNAAGETVTAAAPTASDLWASYERGDLEAGDYEALSEALARPSPVRSDEDVKRRALEMTLNGVDPETFLLENRDRLTAEDMRTALNYHKTVTEGGSGLTNRQQFYFDRLRDVFKQGEFEMLDVEKQERMVNAMIEFRQRVEEGEPEADVFRDVHERSRLADAISFSAASTPRPRFSVVDPLDPTRLDTVASKAALIAARQNGEISEPDFMRQMESLVSWHERQMGLDARAKAEAANQ